MVYQLVHGPGQQGGPWTRSTRVVHGLGPQGWSMDQVHRGSPWTWVYVLYTGCMSLLGMDMDI